MAGEHQTHHYVAHHLLHQHFPSEESSTKPKLPSGFGAGGLHLNRGSHLFLPPLLSAPAVDPVRLPLDAARVVKEGTVTVWDLRICFLHVPQKFLGDRKKEKMVGREGLRKCERTG